MNLYRKRLRRAAVALRKATNLLPPDDALAAVETRGQATRLLRTLTPREREALVLTAYLGYSTEEAGRLETRAYATAPTPSAIQPLRVHHVRAVACEMLHKANVSGR